MAELACFSPCRRYRYRLERSIGPGLHVAVVMVNPSAADAVRNDPTIRRVVGLALREGWGRIVVVNLFALIDSRVTALAEAGDPAGPDNARHITAALSAADLCVAAWGTAAKLPLPLREVWRGAVRLADQTGKPLHCWGMTRDGHPRHPLYLPRHSALRPWIPPL